MGDIGNNWRTFQWFAGEPTVLKNMWSFGEEVGTFELFKGPYMLGAKCTTCRKLILDF